MLAAEESTFQLSCAKTLTITDREPLEAMDPNEEVTMSVLVRRSLDSLQLSSTRKTDGVTAEHRRYLSREELAQMFGSFAADLEYVAQSSRKHGLTVVESNPARRTLVLKGTLQQVIGFAKVGLASAPAQTTCA